MTRRGTRKNHRTRFELGRAVAMASALSLLLSAGVWAAAWRAQSGGAGAQGFGPRPPSWASGPVSATGGHLGAPAGSTSEAVVKGTPTPTTDDRRQNGPGLMERLEILDKLLHRESPDELPTPTLVAGARGLEKPARAEPARPEPASPEPARPEPARSTPAGSDQAKTGTAEVGPKPGAITAEPVSPQPVAEAVSSTAVSGGQGHNNGHKGELKVEKKGEPEDEKKVGPETGPGEPIREERPAPVVPPVAFALQPEEPAVVEMPRIQLTLEAPDEAEGQLEHAAPADKPERLTAGLLSQTTKDSSRRPKHGGK